MKAFLNIIAYQIYCEGWEGKTLLFIWAQKRVLLKKVAEVLPLEGEIKLQLFIVKI